jgi:hypothetical protein
VRSVERVECAVAPPLKTGAEVARCVVSGACREPVLLGLKALSARRWV